MNAMPRINRSRSTSRERRGERPRAAIKGVARAIESAPVPARRIEARTARGPRGLAHRGEPARPNEEASRGRDAQSREGRARAPVDSGRGSTHPDRETTPMNMRSALLPSNCVDTSRMDHTALDAWDAIVLRFISQQDCWNGRG
jgi:hypothetical protein